MCGQSVHERCVKLGIITKDKHHEWQIKFVRKNYQYYADRFRLSEMAELLDINKSNLTRLAKNIGVKTSMNRRLVNAKTRKELYSIHHGVYARCNNPKTKAYKYYGARGIENRLGTLDEFILKMGSEYKKGLTLERIDVNGHYEYDNIKWANWVEQGNNRRNTLYLDLNGERVKFNEKCIEMGLNSDTIRKRIFKYKWSFEKAISTPIRMNNSRNIMGI